MDIIGGYIVNTFTERLKAYRIDLKISTKKEMANKLNISEQLYAMVERGSRKPSEDFLNKLVSFSGLKEEYWLYGIFENSMYMKKIEYCLKNKNNNLLCKHILQMLDDVKLEDN